MLATFARPVFDNLRSATRHRPSSAVIYTTLAVVSLLAALGSTAQINHRLQNSHLIEAHFSRMVENPNLLPVPAHFPVFVAATSTGKVEFLGFSICNCTDYRLGQRTKLWLDPANPKVVTPNRLLDVWFLPLLMAMAAAGFSVFALLARPPVTVK
jgi:hypothetical protein